MKRELQAFVFDMDGVLINSHPAHRKAWREFLHCEGVRIPDEELAFILEGRTRSEILRRFLGDLTDTQLHEYGRRKDDFFRSLEHSIKPVPGVLQLLERLSRQKMALAVATSASEIRTFATIERLGLGGCFAAVVTASDVKQGKPDPAVYRLACERLDISPELAIAFDDAPAGVLAARKAGMRCIGVGSNCLGEELLHAGAEMVVSNFACPEFESISGMMFTNETPEKDRQFTKLCNSNTTQNDQRY
jgi:HAD superfamily hydrolase (TIGR01509 family)